jgi:regulator of protease activity HflC (stomatin/prohibitin superfamily)
MLERLTRLLAGEHDDEHNPRQENRLGALATRADLRLQRLGFEQEGDGRKLRCEIPPDGSYEKNWWEKVSGVRKPLISYAVQRSESLSHRFSRIFQAAAGQGSVTVHTVVLFRIADERRVIEELPRDPLRQLEERVAQLAERSIRRLEWREIEEDKLDLEQVILGSKSRSDGGGMLPHAEILEAFAQALGIELLAVNLHWDLPERVLDVLETVQDKERQRAVTRKQHEVDAEKELLTGERTRLAIDGDRLRQYREKLKHDAELNQKLSTSVADGVKVAIGRIAEDVTTVSKLREAMAELNRLSNPALAHINATTVVSTLTPSAVKPGSRFLVEIVFHVEGFDVTAGEGQEVDSKVATLALREGAPLTVRLISVDEGVFSIDDSEASLVWGPPARRPISGCVRPRISRTARMT